MLLKQRGEEAKLSSVGAVLIHMPASVCVNSHVSMYACMSTCAVYMYLSVIHVQPHYWNRSTLASPKLAESCISELPK